MARHATAKKQKHQERAGGEIDAPSIPGGAAGVPEAPAGQAQVQMAHDDPQRQRQATKFMVVNGPRDSSGRIKFYSQGYIVGLDPGKIVTGATHSLKEMRDQGIQLQRVPDIIEEEPPVQELPEEETRVSTGPDDEEDEGGENEPPVETAAASA